MKNLLSILNSRFNVKNASRARDLLLSNSKRRRDSELDQSVRDAGLRRHSKRSDRRYQQTASALRCVRSRFDTIPACEPPSQPRRRSKYALCISASPSKKKQYEPNVRTSEVLTFLIIYK